MFANKQNGFQYCCQPSFMPSQPSLLEQLIDRNNYVADVVFSILEEKRKKP